MQSCSHQIVEHNIYSQRSVLALLLQMAPRIPKNNYGYLDCITITMILLLTKWHKYPFIHKRA